MNLILQSVLGNTFDLKNINLAARLQLINALKGAIDEVEAIGKLTDNDTKIKELEAKLAKAEVVIEAATFCNWCPDAGGYAEGRSVEDCYENLNEALSQYYGVHTIDWPMSEWITENQLRADLKIELVEE